MIYRLGDKIPSIESSAYIAPSAEIIGDVTIGENSSIWFHCTLRGDGFPIVVGKGTNIQDNTVVHIRTDEIRSVIGDYVTIGHNAVIHAVSLDDYSFIGISATLLDGARVRPYGFVAAGALVTPGFEVPEKTLVAGIPAKVVRPLKNLEIEMIERSAESYQENAKLFKKELLKV